LCTPGALSIMAARPRWRTVLRLCALFLAGMMMSDTHCRIIRAGVGVCFYGLSRNCADPHISRLPEGDEFGSGRSHALGL
jgi:hypothetical protein